MTATIEKPKYDMQKAHDIAEIRAHLKRLVMKQTEQKALLRTPHDSLPEATVSYNPKYPFKVSGVGLAGFYMSACLARATQISILHMDLNQIRGKPWEMHAGKKG